MIYQRLTGTGIAVSRACLGTMTFGGQVNEADSIRILHAALDAGVNFIDTADLYYSGESERVTGNALKGRREHVVLATKVFNPCGSDVNDRGLSRRHLTDALENSLRRLQTDYVDLYYLHQPDYNTPIEETMDTMAEFVRSGKVRYIGVSNYAAWQICDLLWCADKRGGIPPVVTQNVYNQITRGIEAELLPMADAHRMGVVVYNPLAAGILTGKHSKTAPEQGSRMATNPMYHDRYWSTENLDAAEALAKAAAKAELSAPEFALRWCANRPGVDSVILGVSKEAQLEQNLEAILAPPLPLELKALCDEVWNGLKGTRFQYNR